MTAWSRRLVLLLQATAWPLVLAAHSEGGRAQGIFEGDGKIYVTFAVVLVILVGLFIYMFAVDRKISKFERKSKKPD